MKRDLYPYRLTDRTGRIYRRARTLSSARKMAGYYLRFVDVDIYGPERWYGPIETLLKGGAQ